MRALVLRGSRYTLALFVPLAVTAIALAAPLLEVWLGHRFRTGAAALSILVSYWLVYGALAVTPGLLIGAGRARSVARLMVLVAAANLALSLALTPVVGLEGPALGTAIPYLVAFPFLLRLALSVAPVRLGELARQAWLPAYSLGAVLAGALVLARSVLDIHTLPLLAAVALGGVAAYWLCFYLLWLDTGERRLIRDTVRSLAS
jgi:O-antigen/teichoic acid export membrane protein